MLHFNTSITYVKDVSEFDKQKIAFKITLERIPTCFHYVAAQTRMIRTFKRSVYLLFFYSNFYFWRNAETDILNNN